MTIDAWMRGRESLLGNIRAALKFILGVTDKDRGDEATRYICLAVLQEVEGKTCSTCMHWRGVGGKMGECYKLRDGILTHGCEKPETPCTFGCIYHLPAVAPTKSDHST